ncbi:hypothetical protein BGX26_008865 [Mortierella sp. AD094]|nr:hypothetical protein BGX26_008865 [Mortierella sp. AD094]
MASQLISFFTQSTALGAAEGMTVASIGLFAGFALSYNVIVMPSLRRISSEDALPIWTHVYRGKPIDIPIVFILGSLASGSSMYYNTKNPYYLISSLVMTLIIPYTIGFISPVEKTLLGASKKNNDQLRELHAKWDRLHFGRTLLSLSGLGLTLFGTFSSKSL